MKKFVLKRDGFSSNRHPALSYCWSMMFFRKPVPTFRHHALTTVALAACVAGSAHAADLPAAPMYKAPDVPAWSWSGFYIGLEGGGGWATSEQSLTGIQETAPLTGPVVPVGGLAVGSQSMTGLFGGAAVGVNWQAGPAVFGLEGDINWSNIDGTNACSGLFSFLGNGALQAGCNTKMPWFATATARVGATVDHALLYVKGGAAWAEFDHTITSGAVGLPAGISGPSYTLSDSRLGFTVGAGIEYALGSNWSAKLEYDYMDFGTKNLAFAPTSLGVLAPVALALDADDRERVQLIKAGLNYRFNWGGPVVARY